MLKCNQLIGFGAVRPSVNAVDVSSGYIDADTGISGAPTSGQFTMAMGLYVNTLPASVATLMRGSAGGYALALVLNSVGQLVVEMGQVSGNRYTIALDAAEGLSAGQWYSFAASANTNAATGSRTSQMLLGGATPTTSNSVNTGSAFTMNFSSMSDFYFGAAFDGAFSMPSVVFGVEANLASVGSSLFSGNSPIYDLATLTSIYGKAPELLFPEQAATFEVNSGTGGDFLRNGTLTDAATSPA